MTKKKSLILMACAGLMCGFADCSASIGKLEYSLEKCPAAEISWPKLIQNDEATWQISLRQTKGNKSIECEKLTYYKALEKGCSKAFPCGDGVAAHYPGFFLKKEEGKCSLITIIALLGARADDGVTESNTRDLGEPDSKLLLKSLKLNIVGEPVYTKIGTHNDIKKWCESFSRD